ncbi:MAG: D-lysine 5,6-aminomutase subunit alpha [Deltaproteobacteria bacterium]|nr:D-lysine 5,6-aminomutase subunit alpha [Deltaproteobacteria bacterium]
MPSPSPISTFAPAPPGFGCPPLELDAATVARCRQLARSVAAEVTTFSQRHSTVATERTVLRLCGVTGADAEGVPLVNRVVEAARATDCLHGGIARPFFAAARANGLSVQACAEAVAAGKLELRAPAAASDPALQAAAVAAADRGLDRILAQRAERTRLLATLGSGAQPLCYVIVATGNIFEDVVQARVAARQGADVIAVIRSTGQSLLDYVPEGTTTEGYGGTYATGANFALMRRALDEVGAELGRYIRLCNYASGLCMPEIACLGGQERLDMMLNDALYGILFRDINMQRTLCDQRTSRRLSALAGIVINTGEDNYLTTADAVDAAHTVVASTLVNEALARDCGLQTWQLGLGHAMEIDPLRPDALQLEIAHALLVRTLFPGAPLKYMPPTKHMTGNVLRGHVQDALFNLVTVLTGQGICLLGMATEAMHTPHIHDRYWALESARMIFGGGRGLGSELLVRNEGEIAGRARQVLDEALALLERLARTGLMAGLAQGLFADIARDPKGGRGLDGVFERAGDYFDPTEARIDRELQRLAAAEAA